ncbi:MAG: biotin/lipoate protein ligase [Bacteroidetes bacterium]|nr:biotin/lipoate protein ligase [Bacteroidota bacterium]
MKRTVSAAWRFVDTGWNTGDRNMAYDEALARSFLGEAMAEGIPTLRLFRWRPWAVSLGYNQNAADLDAAKCSQEGIDVVRRPTGGRAILHAQELTYSVTLPAGRKTIHQVYNDIGRALVRGLNLFGVDAALQRSQPDFRSNYRQPSSIPCFTSSARYEIEWRGRKLVGSAQRRFSDGEREAILQHGSILCGPAHRRLADLLTVADPAVLDRLRRDLEEKTTDLSEILGREIDLDSLGECVRRGFESEWGVVFSTDHPQDVHAHA